MGGLGLLLALVMVVCSQVFCFFLITLFYHMQNENRGVITKCQLCALLKGLQLVILVNALVKEIK